MSFQVLHSLFNWTVSFLLVSRISLFVMDINVSSDIWLADFPCFPAAFLSALWGIWFISVSLALLGPDGSSTAYLPLRLVLLTFPSALFWPEWGPGQP